MPLPLKPLKLHTGFHYNFAFKHWEAWPEGQNDTQKKLLVVQDGFRGIPEELDAFGLDGFPSLLVTLVLQLESTTNEANPFMCGLFTTFIVKMMYTDPPA